MDKPQTLADYLGVSQAQAVLPACLEDIADDAESFCKAVLNSREFRSYIVNSLVLGSIPAAVMLRVMDMAGWQKPPDRVEHAGVDGAPIEVITRIVRVVVTPQGQEIEPPTERVH
jgi:hypothetical protein